MRHKCVRENKKSDSHWWLSMQRMCYTQCSWFLQFWQLNENPRTHVTHNYACIECVYVCELAEFLSHWWPNWFDFRITLNRPGLIPISVKCIKPHIEIHYVSYISIPSTFFFPFIFTTSLSPSLRPIGYVSQMLHNQLDIRVVITPRFTVNATGNSVSNLFDTCQTIAKINFIKQSGLATTIAIRCIAFSMYFI